MEIVTKEFKRCTLMKISGRIDSATAPELEEKLTTLTDEGEFNIALNMAAVDFISSAGLRVLIDTQKRCKRLNRGEIVLVEVPEPIYETFDLAGFLPLFQIFDSDVEAVGSF